jgi:hypothetical protein
LAAVGRANLDAADGVVLPGRKCRLPSQMPIQTETATALSQTLAPEDVRRGDFVSILYEIVEFPSFFWSCDGWALAPEELIRLKWRSADGGTPLKVKAVCLPYVFVKKPCGEHCAIDLRRHALVRLTPEYGRTVWKTLGKQAAARKIPAISNLL